MSALSHSVVLFLPKAHKNAQPNHCKPFYQFAWTKAGKPAVTDSDCCYRCVTPLRSP